ncbi:hypothetical protein [Sporosarcina koreensis]|uniref:Uncharacterized protein n=1 Tax=Sporosarcina koreensis TaxID=334735 RepID=A0ABW0U120_9BACL
MGAFISAGSIKSGDGLVGLIASLAPYYKSGSEEVRRNIDSIISSHLGSKEPVSNSRYEQEIISATNALNAFLDETIA